MDSIESQIRDLIESEISKTTFRRIQDAADYALGLILYYFEIPFDRSLDHPPIPLKNDDLKIRDQISGSIQWLHQSQLRLYDIATIGYLTTLANKNIAAGRIVNGVPEVEGTTGHCVFESNRQKRSFPVFNNYRSDEDPHYFEDEAERLNTRSYVVVPIMLGEVVAGVINIESRIAGFFRSADIHVLEDVSQSLSVLLQAVSNRERQEQLKTLPNITQTILQSESEKQVALHILDNLKQLYGTESQIRGSIRSVAYTEDGTPYLDTPLAGDPLIKEADIKISINEHADSVIGTVAYRKSFILIEDTLYKFSIARKIFRPAFDIDSRSELAVPIMEGEKCIGVINLESDRPNTFRYEDVFYFELLASQLAISRIFVKARQIEKIQQVNLEIVNNIGDIVQSIAHQTSGNIFVIRNSARETKSLLEESAIDEDIREEIREIQEDILKGIDAIKNDIEDVANMFGRRRIENKPFNIYNVLDEQAKLAVRNIKDNFNNDLDIQIGCDAELNLNYTASTLDSHLREIMINAGKYLGKEKDTEYSGQLLITVESFRDIEHDHQSMVRIKFCDNGFGIAPDKLERIFEYGYRAEETADISGTGWGLGAIRNAMRALGGDLYVESDGIGYGSTFTVELPQYLERETSSEVVN